MPNIEFDPSGVILENGQNSSLLPNQAYQGQNQDYKSQDYNKRDTLDQKSLLNYSVDSTLNFDAKSSEQIKQELNKLDFSRLEDLEKTLNYLQMLDSEDLQMYFDVVL